MLRVEDLNDEIDRRYASPEGFCRRVRQTLRDHKITQAALAREAGYDYANVNRWLCLRQNPSLPVMLALDEALERLLED
jgi:transcriptional regulator with XRE-family HTH domain